MILCQDLDHMDRNLESLQEYLDTDIHVKKEWFDNDFMQSVLSQYMAGQELSEPQKKGLLKSFVYKMKKDRNEAAYDENAEPRGSWVGKVKKRYDLVLKYESSNSTSRGFYVYNFVDRNDNRFIMFSDFDKLFPTHSGEDSYKALKKGDVFKIRATVNRHSLNTSKYNSTGPIRETVLNRPKIGIKLGNKDDNDKESVAEA